MVESVSISEIVENPVSISEMVSFKKGETANSGESGNLSKIVESGQSNPFHHFFFAFCFAWLYVVIPNTNFWVFNLVKNQMWSFTTLIAYVEMQDIALPDSKDSTYLLSYGFGFFCASDISFDRLFYWDGIERNIWNIFSYHLRYYCYFILSL